VAKQKHPIDDEFGLDTLDDPSYETFDIDIEPSTNEVIRALPMDFARGAINSFSSRSTIRRFTESALPKGYDTALDTGLEVADAASQLYNEAVNELKPALPAFRSAVGAVTKKTQKFLPKKIAEKLSAFANYREEPSHQYNHERDIENSITAGLSEVFEVQMEEQARQREEERAEEAVRHKVEEKRTLNSIAIQNEILKQLDRQTTFQDTIFSRALKKSLEVQYRQMFIQRDILSLLVSSDQRQKAQLAGILKNTALPDLHKRDLIGTMKASFKDQLIGRMQQSAVEQAAGFVRGITDRLKTSVKTMAQQAAMGVIELNDARDMAAEGGIGAAAGMGAENLGGAAAGYLADKVSPYVSKLLGKNEKIGQLGSQLQHYLTQIPGFANKFARAEHDESTLKGIAARFVKDMLPKTNRSAAIGTSPLEEAMEGTSFDKQTRRSIVEVIPGFLSRIHHELKIIRTKDTGLERTVYNFNRGEFTDFSVAKSDTRKRVMDEHQMFAGNRAVTEFINHLDADRSLSETARNELKKQILNDAIEGLPFEPERYSNMEQRLRHLSQDSRTEISQLARKRYYKEDGQVNWNEAAKTTAIYRGLAEQIENPINRLKALNEGGQLELLNANQLITRKGFNTEANLDYFYDQMLSAQEPTTPAPETQGRRIIDKDDVSALGQWVKDKKKGLWDKVRGSASSVKDRVRAGAGAVKDAADQAKNIYQEEGVKGFTDRAASKVGTLKQQATQNALDAYGWVTQKADESGATDRFRQTKQAVEENPHIRSAVDRARTVTQTVVEKAKARTGIKSSQDVIDKLSAAKAFISDPSWPIKKIEEVAKAYRLAQEKEWIAEVAKTNPAAERLDPEKMIDGVYYDISLNARIYSIKEAQGWVLNEFCQCIFKVDDPEYRDKPIEDWYNGYHARYDNARSVNGDEGSPYDWHELARGDIEALKVSKPMEAAKRQVSTISQSVVSQVDRFEDQKKIADVIDARRAELSAVLAKRHSVFDGVKEKLAPNTALDDGPALVEPATAGHVGTSSTVSPSVKPAVPAPTRFGSGCECFAKVEETLTQLHDRLTEQGQVQIDHLQRIGDLLESGLVVNVAGVGEGTTEGKKKGFFGRSVGSVLGGAARGIGRGLRTAGQGYWKFAKTVWSAPFKAMGMAGSAIGSIRDYLGDIYDSRGRRVMTRMKMVNGDYVNKDDPKKPIRSIRDIKGEVMDVSGEEPTVVLTAEEYQKGLYSSKGKKLTEGLLGIGGSILSAAGTVFKGYLSLIKAPFTAISWAVDKIGSRVKMRDVYIKRDLSKPAVTVDDMKRGLVFSTDKKTPIKHPKDIVGAVYKYVDGDLQQVISEEDYKAGLVDYAGRGIGMMRKVGSVGGMLVDAGIGFAKGYLKTVGAVMRFGKDLIVGSAKRFGNWFNPKERKGWSASDATIVILQQIHRLLDERIPKPKRIRRGSWEEQKIKKDENKGLLNKAGQALKDKGRGLFGEGGLLSGVKTALGGLGGMLGTAITSTFGASVGAWWAAKAARLKAGIAKGKQALSKAKGPFKLLALGTVAYILFNALFSSDAKAGEREDAAMLDGLEKDIGTGLEEDDGLFSTKNMLLASGGMAALGVVGSVKNHIQGIRAGTVQAQGAGQHAKAIASGAAKSRLVHSAGGIGLSLGTHALSNALGGEDTTAGRVTGNIATGLDYYNLAGLSSRIAEKQQRLHSAIGRGIKSGYHAGKRVLGIGAQKAATHVATQGVQTAATQAVKQGAVRSAASAAKRAATRAAARIAATQAAKVGARAVMGAIPVIGWAALAIDLAWTAGSAAYKKAKYGTFSPLRSFRNTQYGCLWDDSDQGKKLALMEELLEENVRNVGSGEFDIIMEEDTMQKIYKIFEIHADALIMAADDEERAVFDTWFTERFKPIFLNWHYAISSLESSKKLTFLNIDDECDKDQKLRLINHAHQIDPEAYRVEENPFYHDPIPPDAIETVYERALAEVEADVSGGIGGTARKWGKALTSWATGDGWGGKLARATGIGWLANKAHQAIERKEEKMRQGVLNDASRMGELKANGGAGVAVKDPTIAVKIELPDLSIGRKLRPFEAIRLMTYGLKGDLLERKVMSLLTLEEELLKSYVSFDAKGAKLTISKNEALEKFGQLFGTSPDSWLGTGLRTAGRWALGGPIVGHMLISKSPAERWLDWFENRFALVFLNFVSAAKQLRPQESPLEVDKKVVVSQLVTMAHHLVNVKAKRSWYARFMADKPVWEFTLSPWADDEEPLNGDRESIEELVKLLAESAKEEEKSVDIEIPKTSQSSTQPKDTALNIDVPKPPPPPSSSSGSSAPAGSSVSGPTPIPASELADSQARLSGKTMGQVGGDAALPIFTPQPGEGGLYTQIPMPDLRELQTKYDGSPHTRAKLLAPLVMTAAKMAGVNPEDLMSLAAIESMYRPWAKAKTSSAAGMFQFIKATWKDMLTKYGAQYGLSPGHDPYDPRASALMAAEYIKENHRALRTVMDRQPNTTDSYMAHFLGAGNAKKFFKMDVTEKPAYVQSFKAPAQANKPIFYKNGAARTASEVYGYFNNKIREYMPYVKHLEDVGHIPMPRHEDIVSSEIAQISEGGEPDVTPVHVDEQGTHPVSSAASTGSAFTPQVTMSVNPDGTMSAIVNPASVAQPTPPPPPEIEYDAMGNVTGGRTSSAPSTATSTVPDVKMGETRVVNGQRQTTAELSRAAMERDTGKLNVGIFTQEERAKMSSTDLGFINRADNAWGYGNDERRLAVFNESVRLGESPKAAYERLMSSGRLDMYQPPNTEPGYGALSIDEISKLDPKAVETISEYRRQYQHDSEFLHQLEGAIKQRMGRHQAAATPSPVEQVAQAAQTPQPSAGSASGSHDAVWEQMREKLRYDNNRPKGENGRCVFRPEDALSDEEIALLSPEDQANVAQNRRLWPDGDPNVSTRLLLESKKRRALWLKHPDSPQNRPKREQAVEATGAASTPETAETPDTPKVLISPGPSLMSSDLMGLSREDSIRASQLMRTPLFEGREARNRRFAEMAEFKNQIRIKQGLEPEPIAATGVLAQAAVPAAEPAVNVGVGTAPPRDNTAREDQTREVQQQVREEQQHAARAASQQSVARQQQEVQQNGLMESLQQGQLNELKGLNEKMGQVIVVLNAIKEKEIAPIVLPTPQFPVTNQQSRGHFPPNGQNDPMIPMQRNRNIGQ